ncbi:unnamed protein product [Clavelina lepadiformis]|uniref:Phospholipid/glycerol acyltransferase domain-containing protein n=1 Tax=Clavelina lepadiformis TaxID=159417 RepID=A0ABP0G7P7_CLALP
MGLYAAVKEIQRYSITHILLAYIFLASGLIVNVIQLLTVPLWYLGFKGLYRTCIINLNYLSWCLIPGIAQWWAGIDVYLYVRPDDHKLFGKENMISVMNHSGQLDWVISWVLSDYCKILGNAKCVVKNALKYIPILGWSFWLSEYVFLYRNLEKDRQKFNDAFKNLSTFSQKFWFLLFPEGTRFTPEKHKKSVEFATKNGLQPLNHLLLPRTKGFVLIAKGLRNYVDAFYDATVCFRGGEGTFINMLEGRPCVVDLLINRSPIADVPVDDEKCAQYIYDVYYEKDNLCNHHKKHNTFPVGDVKYPRYKDYVQLKIHKNYLSLCLLVFWSIVCTSLLAYYATSTLLYGSWIQIAIFTGLVLLVTIVYFLMINTTKTKPLKRKST